MYSKSIKGNISKLFFMKFIDNLCFSSSILTNIIITFNSLLYHTQC